MEKMLTKRNTIIFVGLLTVWRMYLSATLQLHPDEAYYWLWSRHLAPGYYDHAPLVAYGIWLPTLVSQAEFWVRLSGIIVSVMLSVLAWRLAVQLFADEMIAAASVLLLNVLPLTMSSIIITPDIPSFFFWGIAVYAAWQIVRTQKPGYWYLTGALFGLALLSKYTAVLFAPCLFLFLFLTDERKWLSTVHPYLAFLMGCAFFLPVVYWNSTHEWISFVFQLGHGTGGTRYSLGTVFEYIGGQLLVAGPFAWIAGTAALVVFAFRRKKEELFVSMMALPVLLFFAYTSLKQVAGPNWPAFAYFTFSIAAAAWLVRGKPWKKALWWIGFGTSFGLSLLATLHLRFTVLDLARYSKDWAIADATNFFYGYRELARRLEKHPEARFAITPSHQLSAAITYYCRERITGFTDEAVTRPSQYTLWRFDRAFAGQDGLYVHADNDQVGPYAAYFSSTGNDIERLTIFRKGFPIRTYRIITGTGYLQSR